MEAPGPASPADDPRVHQSGPGAPEYIIDMLLGLMRPYPGDPGTPGSVTYARAARAEARIYADRIWAEAWHTGATWGLSRNNQIRVEVSAERLEQLKQECR